MRGERGEVKSPVINASFFGLEQPRAPLGFLKGFEIKKTNPPPFQEVDKGVY
jgi:hypothetical protein